MFRASVVLAALIIVGCQDQTPRPDFLARSQQDCANGDPEACAMLDVLSEIAVRTGATEPDTPDRQQVEKDVDAIMEGISRARSSKSTDRWRIAPVGASARPDRH